MRKILTYGGYFEAFMGTLTEDQRQKINYGLLLLKSLDRVPMFFFDKGDVVVLCNGFQKKTQKTPGSVLELAKKIRKAYYERTR